MIQLAGSEDQDLLIAGANYFVNDDTDGQTNAFWQSPVVLFLCVAVTILAFMSH